MNKFAIQCQVDSDEALRYNCEVKPTVFMGIEVDKLEFYVQVHADNPAVGVIWRHHPNRPWADDPERQAEEAVAHIKGRIGHLLERGLIRWVTCNNEYIMADAPPELVEKADRYIAAFIRTARAELGVGTCWGNFNTGHWGGGPTGGQEIIAAFPRALAAAQEDGDSPISFHEYNWPEIQDDGHWTCGKILRAMPAIVEKYPNAKCMLTEFGVDDGGDPHKGWRLAHPDYDTAVGMFCDGLKWYDVEVIQNAPWLVAVVIFGCGMPHWASFDIAGENRIFEAIKLLGGTGPAPEPPPSNGGNMDIKVFDLEYNERDLAYAEAKYGVAFRRADVEPGQKVYRLVELWEKTGHSSLITQVLNEDGQPIANVDVAFHWPDAPEQPINVNDWHDNFVHGPTNENGEVGPGMGPGAYHGEGEGGPHAVWVRDPDIPSDICEKLGMLAGTNHDHLDQKFQLMVEGEGPGPEPPPPTGEDKWVEIEGGRAFQPEGNNRIVIVAQGERDFYDTRASIGVVGSVWEAGPFHPESLTKYVLTTDYNPGEGEQIRVFWVTIEDCEGKVVGGPFEFEFYTGHHGWWTTLVEWRKAEPPHPPPQPQDNVQALAQAMAAFARDGAARWALLAAAMDEMAGG